MFKHTITSLMACSLAIATESFENLPNGRPDNARIEYGILRAEEGHATILGGKARTGNKALKIMGGKNKSAEVLFSSPLPTDTPCDFWMERWTGAAPFQFTVIAVTPEGDRTLETVNNLGTGGYKKQVSVLLPAGATALRLTAATADKGGVLIDDMDILSGPMSVKSVEVVHPGAYPMLKRAPINPVWALHITSEGAENPPEIGTVSFTVDTPHQLENITLRTGNSQGTNFRGSKVLGQASPSPDGTVTITCKQPLPRGESWLWADASPSEKALVGGTVTFSQPKITIGGKQYEPTSSPVTQRIGYLVSVPGEKVLKQTDGGERACCSFRIPGMIRTKEGTLIGCFDARYKHSGDLCADIDVAVVRSTDGGQTWTLPEVGMDTGPGANNGCGDPCIVQDTNGRIWLQALTCHFQGGASLAVSKAGQDPATTGQWKMTYSDDDGKTWSREFVNPTAQIKKDEWTCILAGPGCGITTKKGVIVFPAQIWQNGANPRCMSTICYSSDGGKNWKYGKGVPHSTSECQVAELADGSLMLNCRNEARSGKRVVYITKDMGETWEPHATNLKALQEPTCQASLVSVKAGKKNVLLFSNPKSSSARDHMTIRASRDGGKTWNEGYEYDTRPCWGYSCIAMTDKDHVGILYEAPHVSTESDLHGIGFIRIPLKTVLTGKEVPAKPAPQAKKGRK